MIDNLNDLTMMRARQGDAQAFAALVEPHRAAARRVATVVLGSPEGVDDVMQDAVLGCWRRFETFRPGAEFRPWFLRSVANTARNHGRSAGRRAALSLRAAGRRQNEPDGPADEAVRREEHQEVLAALNQLGHADRLVLALRHFEGLDEAAIAEVLDCARGTVKSRLSRATARLREELQG